MKLTWSSFFSRMVRLSICALVGGASTAVLIQDVFVFPRLAIDPFIPETERTHAPDDVTFSMIPMRDGTVIELARMEPSGPVNSKRIAIVFHGNGITVDSGLPLYRWFAERGFVTYGPEYRGYGRSKGWASADAILSDISDIVDHIERREGVKANEYLSAGVSVGSGFAAAMAARYDMKKVVLVTPYASLKHVARSRPVIGLLTPLMWNNVDTQANLSKLRDACVVTIHGTADTIIDVENSRILKETFNGSGKYFALYREGMGHNDVFWRSLPEIGAALDECDGVP